MDFDIVERLICIKMLLDGLPCSLVTSYSVLEVWPVPIAHRDGHMFFIMYIYNLYIYIPMNKYLRTKSFGYHFTSLRLSDTFRTIKGFAVCFVLFFPVSLSLSLPPSPSPGVYSCLQAIHWSIPSGPIEDTSKHRRWNLGTKKHGYICNDL